MELHEFILENMEAILQEWEDFARSMPPGERMDISSLRDHAKEILQAIAEDMLGSESKQEQARISKGEGDRNEPVLKFSIEHAIARRTEGFDLNQVVAEYRALRTSVIQLWTKDMEYAGRDALYQLVRFNEGLDQTLTYVVKHYSKLVEKDRKESEQALRDADLRKDEFLATLAHELRNPLAPVQTGINALQLMKGMPAGAQRPLKIMHRQMAHLVRLVDDLMDISRISRGKISFRLEKVDINSAVREALEATRGQIRTGQREIVVDLPSKPAYVQADPVRMVQVIGNLLSNAGRHTAEDGQIRVSVHCAGQRVHLTVADDGAGIADDNLDSIFDLFVQVDSSAKDGLGIGLALVRRLVELHGGSISVNSAGLGHGSEFTVYLPLFTGASPLPRKDEEEPHDISGRRVLIIDDNQDAAESLGMLLELLGAQASTIHEGAAALSEFERLQPHVVLLDIGMPGMDGYQVAQAIRSHPLGQSTVLIAITGFGQEEDRQRTLSCGFNGHLVKPVGLGDLQRAIGAPVMQ